MTHERKTMPGALIVKDAARGEVSAVFATLDTVDLDGDTYAPGAIRPGEAVVSAWNHGAALTGGSLPVGKATVRTVGNEAIADVQYFLDLEAGRSAFEVVKRLGATVEWSWQLDIRAAEPGTGSARRLITDVVPIEVSPVAQAAGVGTRTIELRSVDATAEFLRFQRRRYAEHLRGELSRIREAVR